MGTHSRSINVSMDDIQAQNALDLNNLDLNNHDKNVSNRKYSESYSIQMGHSSHSQNATQIKMQRIVENEADRKRTESVCYDVGNDIKYERERSRNDAINEPQQTLLSPVGDTDNDSVSNLSQDSMSNLSTLKSNNTQKLEQEQQKLDETVHHVTIS